MAIKTKTLTANIENVRIHGVNDWYRFYFTAMGSPCEVMLEAKAYKQAEEYMKRTLDWVQSFEDDFSFYKSTSLVSQVNHNAGKEWTQMNENMKELTALCDWFYMQTDGVFDPTAGPVLNLWDYHSKDFRMPTKEEVSEALKKTGWNKVQKEDGYIRLTEEGMKINFGGIGKEYAVDKIMTQALESGFNNVLINFGHDVRVHGAPPQKGSWLVGLENPQKPGQTWSSLALNDGAVCSSGNYLRYARKGEKQYGHIIDSRTGWPVENDCLSTHVIGQTCTEAGILSTASFILGAEKGVMLIDRMFGAEGCIRTERGYTASKGFYVHSKD